ncbi:MAG TPA: hypothetical protein PK812_12380 [Beijerinckiaceae bacterium]|nr:hypothetical protein [Beijerinckiaceae bacterium]
MIRRSLAALAVLAVFATPALADAIDGDWCAPEGGKSLSIDGPRIRTPGGATIQGQYSRHHFNYTAPAGDPVPGAEVQMILMGEYRVRVVVKGGTDTIWRRCPPGTS